MTVLSVVQEVALAVGVDPPTTLLDSERTVRELRALTDEIAQRIAYDTREWTVLKRRMTMTGNGTQASFTLPADYQRMLVKGQVYRASAPTMPLHFISDSDDWLQRRLSNTVHPGGEYTFEQVAMPPADPTRISITLVPTLSAGDTAHFMYINKNCYALAAGGVGDFLTADGDRFLLPERLLKLGMIWQWKANKGSPYAEDMGTFTDAIMLAMGADKPAPIMAGRAPIAGDVTIAYPWPVPT